MMEDGDEAEIARALAAIARARSRAGSEDRSAGEAGTHSSFDADNATSMSLAQSALKALGLKLNVLPADAA